MDEPVFTRAFDAHACNTAVLRSKFGSGSEASPEAVLLAVRRGTMIADNRGILSPHIRSGVYANKRFRDGLYANYQVARERARGDIRRHPFPMHTHTHNPREHPPRDYEKTQVRTHLGSRARVSHEAEELQGLGRVVARRKLLHHRRRRLRQRLCAELEAVERLATEPLDAVDIGVGELVLGAGDAQADADERLGLGRHPEDERARLLFSKKQIRPLYSVRTCLHMEFLRMPVDLAPLADLTTTEIKY